MFLGTYQTTFSGKSGRSPTSYRVVLPKKMRLALSGDRKLALTRGLDGCIWGFAKKAWEKEVIKQLKIPVTKEKGRILRRLFFSAAQILELDQQGRFVIPSSLLITARIEDEVLIVGAGDHFEIWNPILWEKIIENSRKLIINDNS